MGLFPSRVRIQMGVSMHVPSKERLLRIMLYHRLHTSYKDAMVCDTADKASRGQLPVLVVGSLSLRMKQQHV